MVNLDAIRLILLLGAALPAFASATELYRYVNDKGFTVIDRMGVPPQYIGNGYEVINEHGRVIRVVPPAPTAEEFQRQQEAKAQAQSDAQLLRLYSSVEDVERAKERKLAELDSLISVARGNMQAARQQQSNLQSQAADHERAGRPVPEHLLVQINNLQEEQQRLKKDIERYRQTRQQAEETFAVERARLVELLGQGG